MPHYWIYNSDPEIKRSMLSELGINDTMELFKDVPENLILKKPLHVGFGRYLSEYEILRFLKMQREKILHPKIPPFTGIEMCIHFVPAVVKELMLRNEFYTAYTPYQPEINQGILQALFEYQSVMAELYGVEVVNASMYDGSTALAEAIRMAIRATRRRKIVIARSVSPIKRRVVETWTYGIGVSLHYIGWDENDGSVNMEELSGKLDADTAAVVVEVPNVFGVVEHRLYELAQEVHRIGGLLIVFANPLALGVIKPPGELGADIVVGEGQPLGLGLYYGGSTLGILGVRRDMNLIRQMPGKLVGMTRSYLGERGFALVLQTREQHIRRERATSNITTNSALNAIAALIYVTWLGGDGIRKLSLSIAARTEYLREKIRSVDRLQAPLFTDALYFMKIPIKFLNKDCETVSKELRRRGILCCSDLGRYDSELRNIATICVTEVHSKEDIDTLVDALKQVVM
ncbi:MAG TPA: aminomethyl-transferring glycine dehydrogenase subunit GcvPA [Ignisphaera aggregans]|uniref:Probable glycine dehydrogenase (decarboxylating) subunit 1 n=1 Tax=Ignisphaera aggregans TaxID=334771 RepID=A0A833DT02_9CREN|nr:aminomethyl-transferring glycine dehydrogenase subunit GcvPA [Ignisphaera aggregans]